jgi:hypothetical protein
VIDSAWCAPVREAAVSYFVRRAVEVCWEYGHTFVLVETNSDTQTNLDKPTGSGCAASWGKSPDRQSGGTSGQSQGAGKVILGVLLALPPDSPKSITTYERYVQAQIDSSGFIQVPAFRYPTRRVMSTRAVLCCASANAAAPHTHTAPP